MNNIVIGIDLGTTNSEIAILNNGCVILGLDKQDE